MRPKRKSRVLWFNYALLFSAALTEALPAVQVYFPRWASAVVAFAAIVNIILRHLTSEPLVQAPGPIPPDGGR